MSPEQADGRPITARCDQYSLGGVMYALLAGRPPFQAKNLPQMLQLQRFAKPEPVRRYAPDTPEQMERLITQLLAKNPADRFPNTQVLARHLQAMVKALSRPAHDDFALAVDAIGESADAAPPVLADDATLAQANHSQPGAADDVVGSAAPAFGSPDAATLAANEVRTSGPSASHTMSMTPRNGSAISQIATERRARFTTVEEDEARQRAEHQRSWSMVAAQLAALVVVLAGMAAVAMYVSRPYSANRLYELIMSRKNAPDEATLAFAERDITEFLQRFPSDPRAAAIAGLHRQIRLDKADRRLQREARTGGNRDQPQLPAEREYLRAVNLANENPDAAIAMLKSLIDLYGPAAGSELPTAETPRDSADKKVEARISTVVQLARRRLESLQQEWFEQSAAQRAAISDRLEAADRLSGTDPHRAAAIYQAIIDLYQREEWGKELVEQARKRLAALNPKVDD
jgi:hypothetical protein